MCLVKSNIILLKYLPIIRKISHDMKGSQSKNAIVIQISHLKIKYLVWRISVDRSTLKIFNNCVSGILHDK